MPPSVNPLSDTVSNLDLFRVYRDDDDLDLGWILTRIIGPREQTPQMKAGEAFHSALEIAGLGECESLTFGPYRFDFNCDCTIETTAVKELRVQKQYGELEVRGRVDSIIGNLIVDYKTTAQFDPDRLLTGYQWRYYLDMMEAQKFRWNVFVLKETDDPLSFAVCDTHVLEQVRYPGLHDDCMKLASDYAQFAREQLLPRMQLAKAAI